MNPSKFTIALVIFLSVIAPVASAQEFRGSISGTISDSAGAAVPGANITVTNAATNTPITTKTNEEGNYTVPFLTPSQYVVTVEAANFKRLARQNVEVRVGDRLVLDLTLEPGGVQDTVTVTGDTTPLLDAGTATAGQVIDRRRVAELPLGDGNPFTLTRLAPGVVLTDPNALRFTRAFDVGGTSAIRTDGAFGGNEYSLDGAPNSGAFLRGNVNFVPPADAVQEFKVTTTSFDAQQGHTAGATVDVTLRSGQNRFFGSAYEFVRNEVLSGAPFFTNANPNAERTANGKAKRPPLRYNRYGATIGGPLFLPRFGEGGKTYFSGRDRTFFFAAYEGLKQATPQIETYTVPTPAQRSGDFSALLPQNIVIYNPFTARLVNGVVVRDPFPGNIIPGSLINPVARNVLSFFPSPNQAGNALGQNNYIVSNPRTDLYNTISTRVDHNFNQNHRLFVRYSYGKREQITEGIGTVNGVNQSGTTSFRTNHSAVADHVATLTPTTILNLRASFARFGNGGVLASEGVFNAASLGFSPRTAGFFGADGEHFPRFEVAGYAPLGNQLTQNQFFYTYAAQPTLTKTIGNHNVRAGYDFRLYKWNLAPARFGAGRYIFNADFARQSSTSPSLPVGQSLASFLLGLPTGGQIDRNAFRSNEQPYHGLFVQDDWKVTPNLTLNLGLRYEYEGAVSERYNRNIRGFDPNPLSPIEAQARAAYAANPIPQIPASDFRVRGGLGFATEDNPGFYNPDKNNFQPRIGFAYQINEKTVLRGGFAMYTVPFYLDNGGISQLGFSQPTQIVPTTNAGLTFQPGFSLADPFPAGVPDPPGSSQGLATFLGRSLDFVAPLDRENAQSQRYELSLQRELPKQIVVEAAYVGTYNYDLPITYNLNALPSQYLSTSLVRDQANISFLTGQVPNPFRGLLPGTPFNGATISRSQLLRPFPQFDNILTQRYDGKSVYHSGQFRAERRFTQGFSVLASYTFSKLIDELELLNPTDAEPQKIISFDDIPHRFAVSSIYELPFGRGRRFLGGSGRLLNALIGGFQVQGIYQYQSGRPLFLPNNSYFGDLSNLNIDIDSSTVTAGLAATPNQGIIANDTLSGINGFYFTDAAVQRNGVVDPVLQRSDPRIQRDFALRYTPLRISSFRSQPRNLWDISVLKNIEFGETMRLQLRAEFLNTFNTPLFTEPNLNPTNANFGRTTTQANLPRDVQLAIKFIF